jgi:hypothetical protein
MQITPNMSWYVSYVSSGDVSAERTHRSTRTFADEREAKTFARARFEAGDKTLIAGTINPVTPKRVIASAAIADWLDTA